MDTPVSAEESANSVQPEEKPAKTDEDYENMARNAFTSSTNYFDTNIRLEIERDIRQWQSKHFNKSKYMSPGYKGRSKLFRPKTRASIQKAEAQAAEALFSTVEVINILPNDPDDEMEVMQAKFKEALIEPRLAKRSDRGGIDWYLTCMGAFQETMVTGVCIGKCSWFEDEKKGRSQPRIDLVPIENFRFDPACDWRRPCDDSPYLIEQIPMYVSDVKKMFKGKASEGEIMSAARQIFDSVRQQREERRTDSTTVNHSVHDFSVVWVHANIIEIDGEDMFYYTLGTNKLLSDPVPLAEAYPGGRNYVVGFSTIEAHKHYPQSAVRMGRELQAELNDLANQRMDNVRLVLNKRYFAARDAQVDVGSLTRNVIGSTTLMQDPNKDVKIVETPDVTNSSYKEADLINIEFDDVVGQFSQTSVQSNKNLNETVGGMQMLTSTSNQIGSYRLKTFVESWVEPMLTKLIQLEVDYEEDLNLIFSAALQAGAMEFLESGELDESDLFAGDHEVRVDMTMGATTPQEKANLLIYGFNAIKGLLQDDTLIKRGLNVQAAVKEVFGTIGFRDGSRFFTFNDEDPIVGALKQEIQGLQQELEAKHPAALMQAEISKIHAMINKMEAEKVSKTVESIYSAMQSAQVLASVPSTAPIADQVLQDSGFKPDQGVDPNLPQMAEPAPELSQRGVLNPMTGVGFVPGGTENPNIGSPEEALQPDVGEGAGIETPQGEDNIR